MKSVLISIQPKWCELIANGKKTVEVRKTKPKLETPFKVYIYCTKGETIYLPRDIFGKNALNGKVIGEFVCKETTKIKYDTPYSKGFGGFDIRFNIDIKKTCLTEDEICEYLGEPTDMDRGEFHPIFETKGFAWHISDLVIYDKPKELNEFKSVSNYARKLRTEFFGKDPCCVNDYKLTRPPQSWCYVERSDNNGE